MAPGRPGCDGHRSPIGEGRGATHSTRLPADNTAGTIDASAATSRGTRDQHRHAGCPAGPDFGRVDARTTGGTPAGRQGFATTADARSAASGQRSCNAECSGKYATANDPSDIARRQRTDYQAERWFGSDAYRSCPSTGHASQPGETSATRSGGTNTEVGRTTHRGQSPFDNGG